MPRADALPSWRKIAVALGTRLAAHAVCPQHPYRQHNKYAADCPYCDDVRAVEQFRAKLRSEKR